MAVHKRSTSVNGVRTAQYRLNPTRNAKGQLQARKNEGVNYNSSRDDAAIGVKNYKGDNVSARAISGLREAQQSRNTEVTAQKNRTRGGNGRFLNKAQKARNARNARAKESYDIKKAFGVNVG